MSNCTSKEDSDDSSKDSKKAKKPSMYLLLFRIIRFNNIHYYSVLYFGDFRFFSTKVYEIIFEQF